MVSDRPLGSADVGIQQSFGRRGCGQRRTLYSAGPVARPRIVPLLWGTTTACAKGYLGCDVVGRFAKYRAGGTKSQVGSRSLDPAGFPGDGAGP
jgi:hypothetical protein